MYVFSLRGIIKSHHCHPDWHFWKRAPSVTQNPLCLMCHLLCGGGSSSATYQRLAAESLEPKHPSSDWLESYLLGMVIHWFEVSHMNLRAIWLPFFPERFFPFHIFPGTGTAEQPYNAGCSSWQFPKCCEQSMPGIFILNNHSRSSASVKSSRPLILKAINFPMHKYMKLPCANLGFLTYLRKLPFQLGLNLLFPALVPQTLSNKQSSCLLLKVEIHPLVVILAASSLGCVLSDMAFS